MERLVGSENYLLNEGNDLTADPSTTASHVPSRGVDSRSAASPLSPPAASEAGDVSDVFGHAPTAVLDSMTSISSMTSIPHVRVGISVPADSVSILICVPSRLTYSSHSVSRPRITHPLTTHT